MNKPKKLPEIPIFEKRQKEFIDGVNKMGGRLGIAIIAKLNFTEDGITPKLFLADTFEKPKKK